MLVKNVYYKYYRMIPKGWKQYAKDNLKYSRFGDNQKLHKMSKLNRMVREPMLFLRSRGFRDFRINDVPADARGGLTECYVECLDETSGKTIVFIGKAKCRKDETFCYQTGRNIAYQDALDERNRLLGSMSTCSEPSL